MLIKNKVVKQIIVLLSICACIYKLIQKIGTTSHIEHAIFCLHECKYECTECRKRQSVRIPVFSYCPLIQSSICPANFDETQGNLVISSVLSGREDPQRGHVTYCRNCYSYFQVMYNSARSFNLSILILHDFIPDEEVTALQTQDIRFIKVYIGNLSLTDERWFMYARLLNIERLPHVYLKLPIIPKTSVKSILITDSSDIIFHSDPFVYINSGHCSLFVHSEGQIWNDWMENNSKTCQLSSHNKSVIWNTGIIAGSYETTRFLMNDFVKAFNSIHLKPGMFCDMAVANYVLQHKKGTCTGWPLHSRFKKYEQANAFLSHK